MSIGLFDRLSAFLRNSKRIHIKAAEVQSPAALVALIDRFIEGKLRYPLEWDDFISWQHSNETIERTRIEIANLEPDFMAKDTRRREKAMQAVIGIRNHYARLLGISVRENP